MISFTNIIQTVAKRIESYFSSAASGALEMHTLPNGNLHVVVPLDSVCTATLCSVLDANASVQQLTIAAPRDQGRFLARYEEISETLVWFLQKTTELKDLNQLVLPLDLAYDSFLLRTLEQLPSLRLLELMAPSTYDFYSVPEDSQATLFTNVGLLIEKVPELEQVVVPENWAVGTLKDLLERTFKYKRLENLGRVRYHTRGRDLLYGTPVFLIPYL